MTLPATFRHLAGSALLLSLCSLGSPKVNAQQEEFDSDDVVHLLQEPRHRTVVRDGGVFLLDVQINPGDRSYPHTHNQPILLTYITDENGSRDGEVVSRTEYTNMPLTHVVDNPGPGLKHIMAMVNDNPAVPANLDDSPSGITQQPQIEDRWFRSYRIELQPGESTALFTHQNPVAIILGAGDLLHVTREDGITNELDTPGDWAWRTAGAAYSISNKGKSVCAVIINESRVQRN